MPPVTAPLPDYSALFASAQASKKLVVENVVKTAQVVQNSSLVSAPELSLALVQNRYYKFRYEIAYSVTSASVGSRFTITGPAFDQLNYSVRLTSASGPGITQARHYEGLSGYGAPSSANTLSAAPTGNLAVIEGIVHTTEPGDLVVMFASENNTPITVLPGSWGRAETP